LIVVSLVVNIPKAGKSTIGSSETTASGNPSLLQSVTSNTIVAISSDWVVLKNILISPKATIAKTSAMIILVWFFIVKSPFLLYIWYHLLDKIKIKDRYVAS